MDPIYHLAEPEHWSRAQQSGLYEQSTRGVPLADAEFIHASSEAQWPLTRQRFYADVETDLLLLVIDPDRLAAPVVWEVGDPVTGERFPHIYGPIEVTAVVEVHTLHPPHDAGSGRTD